MGNENRPSSSPDPFSTASTGEPPSPSARPVSLAPANSPSTLLPRHVLPKDLTAALKHIEDEELDRLLAAVLAEHKHRRRRLPVSDESTRKSRVDVVAVSLTSGKLNAVRAAFKAGVTPSRIARQFGVSQSDVRKVLASDKAK
jgi:hypothetical protein